MSAPVAGSVRRATAQDLDRLAALWTALTLHHAALDPAFALRSGSQASVRALLASQLRDPDAALFVYDVGGELLGFCGVRVDAAPPILEERQRAEITDLAVREGARRRGIGSALVDGALDWVGARGVARVEVRVAAGNPEGQGFWRSRGFADLVDVLQRRL